MNRASISDRLLYFIKKSDCKRTSTDIVKALSVQGEFDQKEIKRALSQLINEGKLTYIQEFGNSFIVPSHLRPVRITDRIIIKPSNHQFDPKPNDVVVSINQGASFGMGTHPTTRLGLKCLDKLCSNRLGYTERVHDSVLDVGTGSGVLAIAAVLLGRDNALGIDIDPCSIFEARANVMENGLEDRITIENLPFGSLPPKFSMVIANLRYPTLMDAAEMFMKLIPREGDIILSGIRQEEADSLIRHYNVFGCKITQKYENSGWVGLLARK